MSVQFGVWSYEDQQPSQDIVEKARGILAPYGPDGGEQYAESGIRILYRAFHTTKESQCEKQPYIARSGVVITWDGRLDNRAELVNELRGGLTPDATDVEIVGAAYDAWDANAFARLIGDWALSVWKPASHSLLLAKDPLGMRPLYYAFDKANVTWSSLLDPLLTCSDKTFALEEEFIAGWLTYFPAMHLTPYIGIHSVPASSVVSIRHGSRRTYKYWDFDGTKTIRYRTDTEYEEHFRTVFAMSVRRRLRSDRPVLAELSGGRDSSAIVCMADKLIAGGEANFPRLDTVSYYDDSEPNWNERPFFSKVETSRGRTGWHVDLGSAEAGQMSNAQTEEFSCARFATIPSYETRPCQQFSACLASQGSRVVLSGIGGDEVMGGVPTPLPELEDLIASRQLKKFARQLKVWSLQRRKPWLQLFGEVIRSFSPPLLVGVPKNLQPAPWLRTEFVKRHRPALTGYPSRTKLFGPLPSFQENLGTLSAVQRQLACKTLPLEPSYEKRYPYLDRSLLEFMLAVPREQLVRPNQRRSLMRRALVGIVPEEILNRKAKAFVARGPLRTIANHWSTLMEITHEMVSASLGIVDPQRMADALRSARRGEGIPIVTLMRTIQLECWLRSLCDRGLVRLNSNASTAVERNPSIWFRARPLRNE